MSTIVYQGAVNLDVYNYASVDNVTPVVIDVNPSRKSLGIMNTSEDYNLLVRIVDKDGIATADLLLLPGQLYEPLVIFQNEIHLLAATANPVSITVLEG